MKMNPDCYDKDADTIKKEDECKLLFLVTPSARDQHNHTHHNHGHLPVWSWKPFGKTKICDTEAELRGHLECGCHVLKYEGYNWELEDGSVIKDTGLDTCLSSSFEFRAPEFVSLTVSGCLSCEPAAVPAEPVGLPPVPDDLGFDMYTEHMSRNPTRGIYCYLRQDGCAAGEKEIYQHSWVDVWGDSDEEEVDEKRSDRGEVAARMERVKGWLSDMTDVNLIIFD
ncbi:hypothetical protein N7485_008050 [Penicillium canescens]|nr:hypothetical protein N7485_008050 [Penicillium canescens]